MKSLNSCPTKASTPLKQSIQIHSLTSLSESNKRKKSLTVYSAVKTNVYQNEQLDLLKVQKDKPKVHLKLLQPRRKQSGNLDLNCESRKQETAGVMIKMNLCGPKGCETSIQDSFKQYNQAQTSIQKQKNKTRLLFQTKKHLPMDLKSQVKKKQEFKFKNLPNKQYFQTNKNQVSYQGQQQMFDQNINIDSKSLKKKHSEQHQYENLENKGLKLMDVQQKNVKLTLNNCIDANINKQQSRKQSNSEHTKNDSFSIRYNSSIVNPSKSFFNNSAASKAQNRQEILIKLKQMYQYSFSAQQSNFTIFQYENFNSQNCHIKSVSNLNPNEQSADQKLTVKIPENLACFHESRDFQTPPETSRTIIQILNDWDCQSELYQQNLPNSQVHQLFENPEALSRVILPKKAYQ